MIGQKTDSTNKLRWSHESMVRGESMSLARTLITNVVRLSFIARLLLHERSRRLNEEKNHTSLPNFQKTRSCFRNYVAVATSYAVLHPSCDIFHWLYFWTILLLKCTNVHFLYHGKHFSINVLSDMPSWILRKSVCRTSCPHSTSLT